MCKYQRTQSADQRSSIGTPAVLAPLLTQPSPRSEAFYYERARFDVVTTFLRSCRRATCHVPRIRSGLQGMPVSVASIGAPILPMLGLV